MTKIINRGRNSVVPPIPRLCSQEVKEYKVDTKRKQPKITKEKKFF